VAAQHLDKDGSPTRSALVVEDDPDVRALVGRMLRGSGLQVSEVSEGRSAILHLATHETPDLVCLDLMLPELSGYDVCEYMRGDARLKAVPILILSARALPQDRAYAEQVGATSYLVKPFKQKTFQAAVDALLVHSLGPEGRS